MGVSCSESEIKHDSLALKFTCCRYVIKELVHAFSCAYIELWMHLGSLESTQEARVALGCASSNSFTLLSCSPNFPRASITRYTYAKHEPILNEALNPNFTRKLLVILIQSAQGALPLLVAWNLYGNCWKAVQGSSETKRQVGPI